MVCKLNKALYGFNHSDTNNFHFFFEKLGLMYINADHNIFTISQGLERPIVSAFIDNIKIIGSKNTRIIAIVKIKLIAAFEMIDMESISFYLSLKIDKNCQKK